jgi:hypothetical protein
MKPELVVVDRLLELPRGRRYVLSFIEIWGEAIVVRMLGLAQGSGRELGELRFSLRDNLGRGYEWRATTSGGMVLPEEVSIGFAGPVRQGAGYIEVVSHDASIVVRVGLA